MSSMTPVVLVSLPNLPYLLGTFDTAQFRQWWRSAPFPDELETIKKGFHIYGRTHLALAQRTDGRWAIYRSKNYGIDWERVFLAAGGEVIYDIVLITFGRAILNTSLGFYETQNAGTTWALVLGLPGAPVAPAFCNIGGGDVLLCTNGRYIWRSTDVARSWTLKCDMQAIVFPAALYYYNTYKYTGPSVPAIAGACGRVLAANGPYLAISEDGGLTWAAKLHWCQFNQDYAAYYPPRSIVYDRLWPLSNNPKFVISQIIVSSVDGPTGSDVVFLVKCDDWQPVSGETRLYSRVFNTFSATYYNYGYLGNWFFRHAFQQYRSPADVQQVCSYDVAVLGASFNDRLTFSAQTRIDPVTGGRIPSLKYSLDGGNTWIDINLDRISIGDPASGGSYGGSMLEDNFARLTWVAAACNNAGHYNFTELSRRQCQSYESDALLERQLPVLEAVDYTLDAKLSKAVTKDDSMDALLEVNNPKSYDMDGFTEGPASKSYQLHRFCEGIGEKDYTLDVLASLDTPVEDSLDVVLWDNKYWAYLLSAWFQCKTLNPYLVDVIIERYDLNKRLSKLERPLPQLFDINVPNVPYGAYDSRTEEL